MFFWFFFFLCEIVKSDPTGDLEKKCDLEISPMCNQQVDSVPAIQTGECASPGVTSARSCLPAPLWLTLCPLPPGFISYIVEPLFEEWQRFTEPSPLSGAMMAHLHRNKARWGRLRYAHTQSHSHAEEPEEGGGGGGGGGGEGGDIP